MSQIKKEGWLSRVNKHMEEYSIIFALGNMIEHNWKCMGILFEV